MKKFLYIAPVLIDDDRPDGVAKKVLSHISVFEKKYNATLISYGDKGIRRYDSNGVNFIDYSGKKHRRFELYDYVSNLVKKEHFDYVYIRYPRSENRFIKLLKNIRNSRSKIVIEIPTYPYYGETDKNFMAAGLLAIDYIFRAQIKKYVDRIVTYSNDKKIFGIKTINTINGIIFDNIECKIENNKSDCISLIGVAIIRSCQGWDRIIEGMNNYYRNGGKQNLLFNIVGDGPSLKEYRVLVSKYGLEERVIFHGFKSGMSLDRLYNSADIGVNSIAIHRIKLKEESTLKTKEYAAKGLPIISSYPIDAFSPKENKKYVHQVTPDETAVDVNSIIDFYHCLNNNKVERNTYLANDIRKAAKNKCDMQITLEKVFEYFDLEGEKSDRKIKS